jgi:integrase/recombinase XerD
MGATISIFLDTRIKKNDKGFGKVYPLKLRATHERQRRYFGIPKEQVNKKLENSKLEKFRYTGKGDYSIDEDLFKKVMDPKARQSFYELQVIFKGIELEGQKKADRLSPFTFEAFKSLISSQKNKNNKVFDQFDQLIDQLRSEDRIGTANSYNDAKNSLKKFVSDKDVTFEYFTVERLKKYQNWMEVKGNSITTIGMYLRAFRALFNEAIGNGITRHYPFTKDKFDQNEKFKIPKGKGRKIALNKTELGKIFSYSLTEKHPYSFYLDAWKLMYQLGGINPIDLCLLTEARIQSGFISYYRQKTKRTAKERKEIKVPYSSEIKEIIERWRSTSNDDPYLLPVLKKDMSTTEIKAQVANFVKMVNTTMKQVAKDLEIDKKVTTYVSRHSIATQLLRTGAPVKLIGDQLGHHDTKTTEQLTYGKA